MRISTKELVYVDGEHWTAILDNIADLKDYLDREEQLRLASTPDHDLNKNDDIAPLLYGCQSPVSKTDILAALPPKAAVDRYISRYFNRVDLVASCMRLILLAKLC
jgi:hypothetical protein